MVYINSVQKNRYFNITYLLLICQSTSNRSNKYNEQVKNTPQQPLRILNKNTNYSKMYGINGHQKTF